MESQYTVSNITSAQHALQTIFTTMAITHYLFPKPAEVKDGDEYDFIIAGGGTAGSVLAYRLAEAHFTVALLEAGDIPPLETFHPSFVAHLMKDRLDWNHKAVKDHFTDKCHRDPRMNLALGKCLGGSSSVSYMHAFKGTTKDYHRWALASNDSSWEAKNLKPYFDKSIEVRNSASVSSNKFNFIESEGWYGEAKIGISQDDTHETEDYLKSFEELGNKLITDVNDFQTNGYRADIYTLVDGIRQSTAYKYLVAAKKFPTLTIISNTMVSKIIFNKNKSATGVEAIIKNRKVLLRAKKEVIVSAGAVKSPQLLMLSGIGPKEHLKEKSIKPISDLPVGHNLKSTIGVVVLHNTQKFTKEPELLDFHEYPTPTVVGFRSLSRCGENPDYGTITYIQRRRDNLLQYCSYVFDYKHKICNKLYNLVKNRELAYTVVYDVNPKSHGYVSLKSLDPFEEPRVHLNHLSDPKDIKLLIKAIKDFTAIVNTTFFKKSEAFRIDLSNCKEHKTDRDDYWKCYYQCFSANLWNYLGTCAMGRVVNSKLEVIGVSRLRVVDASVIPSPVAGGTYLPTVVIAEKAAEMIKEQYKKQ